MVFSTMGILLLGWWGLNNTVILQKPKNISNIKILYVLLTRDQKLLEIWLTYIVVIVVIVHELEPKKMSIFLRRVDKPWYRFLVTSECLLSRKVWWVVWIGSFWPNIEVFYRPEGAKEGTTWKWILSIFQFRNEYYKQLDQKKQMKKMGSFV